MAFAIEKEERFAAYNAQMCLRHARQVRKEIHEKFEEAQLDREGRNLETTGAMAVGLTSNPLPLFTCGLVAGIRHCHSPDAADHMARQLHFSDSRHKVMRMVQIWISAGVRLAVNLGNIVDQSCRNEKTLALRNIKGVLCDDYKAGTWRFRLQDHHVQTSFRADVLHLLGEHDLERFSVLDLAETLNLPANRLEEDCLYYTTRASDGWKLIFLDTNDISTRSSLVSKRNLAREWLEKARRPGRPARVTNCGAVGQMQLKWLRDQLSAAKSAGDRVVLFSHSPLNETVSRQGGEPELICWNFKEVVDVIFSVSGVVVCCISGQQLDGGYGIDDMTRKGLGRLHHLGIRNSVAEPAGSNCFGILEFFENSLVLQGHGGVKPITMSCPTVKEARAILAQQEATAALQEERAKVLREQELFDAKLAAEVKLAKELEREEADALIIDKEERRLYRVAQEEAAREQAQKKQ